VKTWIVLACLLLPAAAAPGPGKTRHPIDLRMEQAIEQDPSTAGSVAAISKAAEQWDAELNKAYRKLKTTMKPAEWQALVEAQRAWIAFRDAQLKALDAFYANMEGTMFVPMAAHDSMELTRERALYLLAMVDLLAER
jgi:uncharacterized protein YecT (DUF1311 family)